LAFTVSVYAYGFDGQNGAYLELFVKIEDSRGVPVGDAYIEYSYGGKWYYFDLAGGTKNPQPTRSDDSFSLCGRGSGPAKGRKINLWVDQYVPVGRVLAIRVVREGFVSKTLKVQVPKYGGKQYLGVILTKRKKRP